MRLKFTRLTLPCSPCSRGGRAQIQPLGLDLLTLGLQETANSCPFKRGKINRERQDVSTPPRPPPSSCPTSASAKDWGAAMHAVCSEQRAPPSPRLPDLIVKGTAQGPEHLWAPLSSLAYHQVQSLEICPQKVVEAGEREADELLGIRCKDRAQPCPAGGTSTGGGLGGGVHNASCPVVSIPPEPAASSSEADSLLRHAVRSAQELRLTQARRHLSVLSWVPMSQV